MHSSLVIAFFNYFNMLFYMAVDVMFYSLSEMHVGLRVYRVRHNNRDAKLFFVCVCVFRANKVMATVTRFRNSSETPYVSVLQNIRLIEDLNVHLTSCKYVKTQLSRLTCHSITAQAAATQGPSTRLLLSTQE